MDHYSCYWIMTHNVQKGGDFLKSYSANCNQVAFFPWTNRKKGQSPLNIYPRRKNSEQTVWITFSFKGCLSFCKLFGNIWLESDGISEKVVLFFFFTGRNVLNGNFCFISKIASLSEFPALGLICVNNWPKPWTVSCPCKWQTN